MAKKLPKLYEQNFGRSLCKGPYLNYVINHGVGVVSMVVKIFDRNDKQGIVQDDIKDHTHRGGKRFKIFGNRDYVI